MYVYIECFRSIYVYVYINIYTCIVIYMLEPLLAVVSTDAAVELTRRYVFYIIWFIKEAYADLGNIYLLLGRSIFMSVLIDLYPNIYIYIRISSFMYLEPLLAAVCTDAAAQLARRYLSQFILENVVILVYIHWFILMYIYQYI